MRGDRTVSWEFMRIEARESGLVYLASPGGRAPATPFDLVELGDRRAVFENLEHDFPNRIIYSVVGDTLRARIEGHGDDAPGPMEWAWVRQR